MISSQVRNIVLVVFFISHALNMARRTFPAIVYTEAAKSSSLKSSDMIKSSKNKNKINTDTSCEPVTAQHPFERLERWAKIYIYTLTYINLYVFLKYCLFFLFSYGYLKELQILGCIFMGRMMFYSRSIGMSKYFAPYCALNNIRYQLETLLIGNKFSFYCHEFLLISREQVCRFSSIFQSCNMYDLDTSNNKRNINPLIGKDTQNRALYLVSGIQNDEKKYFIKQKQVRDIFCFKLADDDQLGPIYWPRPNRTPQAWDSLANKLVSALTFMAITGMIIYPFSLYPHLTMLTKHRGYEISHGICTDWVQRQRQMYNDTRLYSFILPPEYSASYLAALSNETIRINWYQLMRMGADLFETIVIIMQACTSMVLIQVICIVIGYDICLYVDHIKQRIIILSATLRQREITLLKYTKYTRELHQQVLISQAMTEDAFKLILHYNKFINNILRRFLFVWITYTLMTSKFMFSFGLKWTLSSLDTLMTQLFFASLFLPLIYSFASVRKQTRKLYAIMANCAASYESPDGKKSKWLLLMKIYYPKPLNAFNLNGHSISWFSVLKFLAWIFSVIFVASTFQSNSIN